VQASASDVVILHDSDFDAKVATGAWLIEFYAPVRTLPGPLRCSSMRVTLGLRDTLGSPSFA
jgi:hypothetical protein